MKIDLSKKPEGATHINPHSGLWVKCLGGNSGSYQFFRNGEWEMGFGCMSNSYLEIAQPEPWTGEGLPPVGTGCEYQTTSWPSDQWEVRTVRYISAYHVITVEKDGTERSVCAGIARFRKLRTPEQIAADEREAGIEGIRQAVSKSPNCKAHGVNWDIACAIYDAGYRLQVKP